MGPDISLGFGQKVSAGWPAAAGGPKAILQYSQAGGTCPYICTAIQQYSNTALQQYRPREEIEDRSTAAVIGYARVSTREQAARGLSLEAQKAKVLAMAMLEDGGPEDVQDQGG